MLVNVRSEKVFRIVIEVAKEDIPQNSSMIGWHAKSRDIGLLKTSSFSGGR